MYRVQLTTNKNMDDMGFFFLILLSKLSTESTMQANLASPLDGTSQEVAIGFE